LRKGLRRFLGAAVAKSPLQYWPVSVRAGLAKGAQWTIAPFSANWRHGGEVEVAAAVAMLPRVRGATCWDVGAHFGIHTVGLAMQVGADGRVCAFEPDSAAFARLQRHVKMNRLRNVRLYPFAASDHDGDLELIVSGGLGSTVTHVRYEDEPVTPETPKLVAKAVRLDTLVSAAEIPVPDLIKIDIEGHGGRAIAGALRTISQRRPVIVLSVHSPWEWEQSRDALQPLGYRGRYADGRTCSWDDRPETAGIIFTC
jgi:FkbM family methyltransferase